MEFFLRQNTFMCGAIYSYLPLFFALAVFHYFCCSYCTSKSSIHTKDLNLLHISETERRRSHTFHKFSAGPSNNMVTPSEKCCKFFTESPSFCRHYLQSVHRGRGGKFTTKTHRLFSLERSWTFCCTL